MKKFFLIIFFCIFFNAFSQDKKCIELSHDPGFHLFSFYLKIDICEGVVVYSSQNDLTKKSELFPDSLLINQTTALSFLHVIGDSLFPLGSHTFFLNFHTKFKVVSLSIKESDFFGPQKGIYVDGLNSWFDTIKGHKVDANYLYKSDRWERDVFVEIFDTNKQIISQDAGIRIFGGMTRLYPEKSLRIIARKSYGNSRFKTDVFGDGEKEYKHLILRHSGNDYRKTRFRDALATSLASKSNIDVQKFEPCHLFINSEYWGVYNIREKINEFYFENNYNISTSGIDVLQGYSTVEVGDNHEYKDLLAYVRNHDLEDSLHFQKIRELMDVRNYTNFWIHQIYFSNPDVRGNIRWWRSDSLDGRFRWIIYDTDVGFFSNNLHKNYLADFTSSNQTKWYNSKWVTFLLRNLLKNEEFKRDFINQSCYLLSSFLSSTYVLNVINNFTNLYQDEMILHFQDRRKFQRNQGDVESWNRYVDDLKKFAIGKPEQFYLHLKEEFNLNKTYFLNVSIDNYEYGKVFINNNKILADNFTGNFFNAYNLPIRIIPDIGYSYKGWNLDEISAKDNDTINISLIFMENQKSNHKIIINEINYDEDWIELFNPTTHIINLKGWQLVDENKNTFLVKESILHPKNFAVFYYDTITEFLSDSVVCQKGLFKINRNKEILSLYDSNEYLVDSISYQFTNPDSSCSYSKKIPYDTLLFDAKTWKIDKRPSMGKHNSFFLEFNESLLEEKKSIQAKKIKKRIVSLSLGFLTSIVFVYFLWLKN